MPIPMDTDQAAQLLEQIREALRLGVEPGDVEEALGADTAASPVTGADLEAALAELDIPEEMKEQIRTEYEASGHTTGDVVNIFIEVNDSSVNNEISNELNIHGEVHGNVVQDNDTDLVNATGDDSFAAGGNIEGVQSQSGDGVQVGGDNDGVANVGDNSGQQAGDDASVGGDFTSGDGNVHVEDSYVDDSAIAFGDGDATNEANDTDTVGSHNTDTYDQAYTETNTDSFNEDYTSTENYETSVEAHLTDSANYDESYVSDDDYIDIDKSHNEDGEDYAADAHS
ncbi:MAG: hypothetical protein ACFCVK_00425 [Acidimicrobiales bacterium]